MSHSFRIHIKIPKDKGLKFDSFSYQMGNFDDIKPIEIRDAAEGQKLSEANELIFESHGYQNKTEAETAGEKVQNCIIRTLIKLRKGVDIGLKGPSFEITPRGIEHFKNQFGVERLLEGGLGLKIYESEPKPRFAVMKTSHQVLTPVDKLEQTFKKAENNYREFSQKEFVAAQLYSSSFFEEILESRFLLLVMAIEVLIECDERSKEAVEHVERMEEITKSNSDLKKSERDSILGSLSWLKSQSIGQAGRELARTKLAGNEYQNKKAEKFFTHCYNIRSSLVHGNSSATKQEELGTLALGLEKFVSDLLVPNLS